MGGGTLAASRNRAPRKRQGIDARVDEVLSVAAHELRQPLTAARLAVEAARRRLGEGEEAASRMLWIASSSLDRVSRLLETLVCARGHEAPLQLQRMDLRSMAMETVQALRPLCVGSVVTIDLPATAVVLDGDRTRLEEVLTNLVANAHRHAGPGTRVRVCVSCDRRSALLTVEDDGPGIPPQDLSRIFQPFQRGSTTRAATGLGLGLYLCARIARAHGGSIRAGNRPEGGARFTMRLPLPPDVVTRRSPSSETAASPAPP